MKHFRIRKSNCSRLQRKGATGIAMKALLGPSALCVICLVLIAPMASAQSFSATASAGPVGIECFKAYAVGGSGFTSANTGTVSCADETPYGGTASSTASASGDWVSGGFSTSAVAAANPGSGGTGSSIDATGADTFTDNGVITLAHGITSAGITFGVTGLSGAVFAGPAAPSGGASAANIAMLEMIAGGGTPVTSEVCLNENAYVTGCPGGGFGSGFGTPPSVTMTVTNGESLQLELTAESTGFANAYVAPESASAGITVDPLYLDLPADVTFDSGITGFLSGPPPAPVPVPGTLALLATGLLGLAWTVKRKRFIH